MSLEYLGNCSYPVDYVDMSLGEQLVMSSYASDVIFGIYACTPFKWQYLVMLVAVMMWIIIGRWYYDLFMRFRTQGAAKSFSLAEALTKEDNKALSIDFACFLFSLCWITRGSMMDLPAGNDDARYFGGFFTYQLLGYVLLAIARVINDKLVLRAVDNSGEMVEKKNLGVACAQGGATIGTAIIIAAAAGGVAIDFAEGANRPRPPPSHPLCLRMPSPSHPLPPRPLVWCRRPLQASRRRCCTGSWGSSCSSCTAPRPTASPRCPPSSR